MDQENVSATVTVAVPAANVAVLADPTAILRSMAPAGFRNLPTGRR